MDGDSVELLDWMVVQDLSDVSLLDDVAVDALTLLDALAVGIEGGADLTKKANDLVAVSAFLGVDGNLLADDAGGLFHELLLEVLVHALRLHFEIDELVVWERALADDLVHNAIRHDQVVPVPLGHC